MFVQVYIEKKHNTDLYLDHVVFTMVFTKYFIHIKISIKNLMILNLILPFYQGCHYHNKV